MKAISINQLAFGNLRRRRRQYLTLALGIFLAVYFAATMLLFGASLPQTLQVMHNERKGQQDCVFFNIGAAPLDELATAGLVAEYGMTEILAEVEPRANTAFSAFSLARFDQKALELAGKRLIAGRLPERTGEIALEQEALSLQRITAKPGEMISLQLNIPNGEDYLAETVTRAFLLTGILADQRLYLLNEVYDSHFAYRDYPAGILSDAEVIEAGGQAVRTAYVKLAPGIDPLDSRIQEFAAKQDFRVQSTRFDGWSELFSGNLDTGDVISSLGLAVFMALVLLLAACLGIVNAFSGNLQQRKQQIGLLRAVGATKRQIRQIFGREALLLSIITIPPALALGCLTVRGVTRLLGPSYLFYPQPGVLATVAAFGVGSVWLSARIPLRRAAQIPPMQAIRDADLSRRLKTRKIKSRKRFQMSRLLAARNMTLYRNKLAGITVFIIFSLLLIMIIPFYLEGQLEQMMVFYQADFVIQGSADQEDLIHHQYRSGGLNEGDIAEIAALPAVASVESRKELALNLLVDQAADYFTLAGFNYYQYDYMLEQSASDLIHRRPHAYENYQFIKAHYGYARELLQTHLLALEPQILDKLQPYVYEGSIRPDRIAAGEEILLVAPPAIQFTRVDEANGGTTLSIGGLASLDAADAPEPGKTILVFENDQFHAGDEITLSLLYSDSPVKRDEAGGWIIPAKDAIRIDKTVTIGALLRPSRIAGSDIAPLTSIEGLTAIGYESPYTDLRIQLKEKPDPDLEDYLTGQLDVIANRNDGYSMVSNLAWAEAARTTYRTVLLGAGALVVLFFALVASMVNNTLTARIRAGRRQIGTLRAVGASERDILRSYDLQLVAQFGLGSVLGCIAGWALCYWIAQGPNVPWPSLPIWQPLLFLALLFLICRLNLWLKVRQIHQSSIVANIRDL